MYFAVHAESEGRVCVFGVEAYTWDEAAELAAERMPFPVADVLLTCLPGPWER